MDLLLALSPSILFGSMSLLIVRFGGDNRQQTMGELGGGFLFALLATPFIGAGWTGREFAISFITGVMLGVGIQWQLKAFRSIGVSRTMPVSTGAQLVGVSLGGILLFGEWRGVGAMPVGLAALVLIIIGIWLTTRVEGGVSVAGVEWGRGARELIISTIGLVGYLLVIRWFDIEGRTALLPQALGYVTTALVLTSPRFSPEFGPTDTRWSRTTLKQVIPGLMWGAGVLILQVASARVGVAVGFTLGQLGVVISTLGGIWLLGESRTKRELGWTITGVALVVLGAVLIGVAKALDGV